MTAQPNYSFMRQYKRFKVSNWKHIEALIDRNRNTEQIVMLGKGGCGFYGFQRGYPSKYPHRVFCQFNLKGDDFPNFQPIIAQGNVIYSTPIELGTLKVYFHGVEFLPAEREKIQPLIMILETLHAQNLIELT
jgi:hypothetical protein